jgi:hypothetical protein
VRRDHLGVGDDEQRQHAGDHQGQREGEAQSARSRGDEHEDHRLGPVGHAREGVEAQGGEAGGHAELVSRIRVLADPTVLRQRRAARDGRIAASSGARRGCGVESSWKSVLVVQVGSAAPSRRGGL